MKLPEMQFLSSRILIAADDAALLSRYLGDNGLQTECLQDDAALAEKVKCNACDLVLLDLDLESVDGFGLLRSVGANRHPPVIALSVRNDPIDRVLGLEMGADDYVGKPFHLREILARVKRVLRHAQTPHDADQIMRFDGWTVLLSSRRLISPAGVDVVLSGAEFKLLCAFLLNPGRVLSRDRLIDLTHSPGWHVFDRTIDAHVSRLRRKIEVDPKAPCLIKSVYGTGYLFTGGLSSPRVSAPSNWAVDPAFVTVFQESNRIPTTSKLSSSSVGYRRAPVVPSLDEIADVDDGESNCDPSVHSLTQKIGE